MKNLLAGLALALAAAPAFANGSALAQLRGAASDQRAGAISYDGGYRGEDGAPVSGDGASRRSAVVPAVAEPEAAVKKDVPKPDCPPCPPEPWYKKPLALGAVGAGLGAAVGMLAAPVGFGLLFPAIVGAAVGFLVFHGVSKFAREKGWI